MEIVSEMALQKACPGDQWSDGSHSSRKPNSTSSAKVFEPTYESPIP